MTLDLFNSDFNQHHLTQSYTAEMTRDMIESLSDCA